ncbi:helix-turn-helix domain-containing protein [Flavobacterium sp.]|uniref:IS1/IS1595 family N-terminal zinc-binding domain-containing protein n=1 Tax=Flavobacterium sp. TaxID=239 RepID=UPI00121A4C77|nr:helix-turn-helix domain-containing protein [Flavobacterium sp.]RZJ72757.1 MAG: IS1 family transposase [Flavobacterium sp.]
MDAFACPKCQNEQVVKSGVINDRQRYLCKKCKYYFTVNKLGKKIDNYYVTKALQLYLEGISYREIERIIGVSHVTVSNWVKEFKVKKPSHSDYHPTYKIYNHSELIEFLKDKSHLSGAGMIITELGDKFMLIKWERFKD